MTTLDKRISLEIDGIKLSLIVAVERAPVTTRALLAALPLNGDVLHAMWSGPVCLLNGVRLGDQAIENPVSFMSCGDVVYHPTHHDIGIAYAATQFREPIGAVYVTAIGRIEGNLGALVDFGRRLQRVGARPIRIG